MACCWRTKPPSSSTNRRNSGGHHDGIPAHTSTSMPDSQRRIQIRHALEDDAPAPQAMSKVFQTVRILVVGKSGSGKTTLIRLLLGKEGPQELESGSNDGRPGQHDIEREWRWTTNEDLPLVIHDSNGVDVSTGCINVEIIRKFIEDRKRSSDISDKIHLIWYVIGANDNRISDDGGLMATVATAGVPILLIQTYDDIETLVQQHVTPKVLENLFRSVPLEQSRDIRGRMVRVGNNVTERSANGETIDNRLREVSHATMELLDKHLKYTWIAAQVVDLESKLDATVHLIVETSKRALTTDLFRLKPSRKLTSAFNKLHERVCKIWRIPNNLSAALLEAIVDPHLKAAIADASRHGPGSQVEAFIRFLGFVVTLGAKEVTFRVSVAALTTAEVCVKYEESRREESRWTWRILACGIELLLGVLFAMSRQPEEVRRQRRWGDSSDYRRICREYTNWQEIRAESLLLRSLMEIPAASDAATVTLNSDFLMKLLLRPNVVAGLITDFAVEKYQLFLRRRQDNTQLDTQSVGESSATIENNGLQLSLRKFYLSNLATFEFYERKYASPHKGYPI